MIQFNSYVLVLFLSALLDGGMALYIIRRARTSGSREIALVLMSLCIWSLGGGMEAAFVPFSVKLFWSGFAYLGSQTCAAFFFLFCARYTRSEWMNSRAKFLGLMAIPLISIIMAATNSMHGLLWPNLSYAPATDFGATIVYHLGPWYWIELSYSIIISLLGVFLLVRAIIQFPYIFSGPSRGLLVLSVVPWLLAVILAIITPTPRVIDFSPVIFTISGVVISIAFRRFGLLQLAPVTRQQILDRMTEGVILTDEQDRIIYTNPAFSKVLGQAFSARGQTLESLMRPCPQAQEFLALHKDGSLELLCAIGAHLVPETWYELNQQVFEDPWKVYTGSLITIRDITSRRAAEDALRESEARLRASEQRYRVLIENMGEGIATVDQHETFLLANPAAHHILGLPDGELIGKCLTDYVDTDQHNRIIQQTDLRRSGVVSSYELDVVRPDGSRRIVEVTATPQFDGSGTYSGSLGILRDITARKESEEELRRSEAFLRQSEARLLDSEAQLRDSEAQLRESEAALRQSEAQLRSRTRFLALLNDVTRAALEAVDLPAMMQTLADQVGELINADSAFITRWDSERSRTIPVAASGEERETYPNDYSHPEELTMTESVLTAGHALVADDVFHSPYISPLLAEGTPTRSLLGLPLIAGGRKLGAALIGFNTPHCFTEEEVAMGEHAAGYIAIAMLKNQLLYEAQEAHRQAEDTNRQLQLALLELDELATTDQLTGAYNRNKFNELIRYELYQVERYGQPLSVVMMDIDHFKLVNDTYGHHTGDMVLIEVVKTIKENIRVTDSLTRWGGEEFLIISPSINLEQAIQMAEKLQGIIAGRGFPGIGRLTVSVGVTSVRPGETLDSLLSRADDALYQAKRNGRNRVEAIH